ASYLWERWGPAWREIETVPDPDALIQPAAVPSPTLDVSAPVATPGNLPFPLTSFVGREVELVEIARLLASSRLVTLTGPPGAGKTRLALQAAHGLAREFPNGVYFVSLAPLDDPDLVGPAIART